MKPSQTQPLPAIPPNRITRYQGAIIQDDQMLLILHRRHIDRRSYWAIPGGGIEPGETEEDCILREIREETGLVVRIERLLLDEPGIPGGVYTRLKTYLCTPVAGEAAPGFEPEPEAAAVYAIAAIRWIDLRSEAEWGADICTNRFLYPQLKRIQSALQGTTAGAPEQVAR